MSTSRPANLALRGLRIQLLLWIALPVAVSFLGMSMVEIRGHEQAMTHMVQQQTDLVARSLGMLIDAHIDQRQGLLLQAASHQEIDALPPVGIVPAFAAGVAIFPSSDASASFSSTSGLQPAWVTLPPISALVSEVRRMQAPSLTTVYDNSIEEWLVVQAVPIPSNGSGERLVMAGAESVAALAADDLDAALDPALLDELRIITPSGDLLYAHSSARQFPSDSDHAERSAARWVKGQTTSFHAGWQVIVNKDWRDLVPPLLNFGNAALVIVAVAVVLSLLSAYFGLRNIVWPLQRLDQAVNQAGWGDFTAIQQPVGGVAEIEELRHALARMTDQVRQYQQDLQSYIGAMTLGQEEERRRLARELHDETVQGLIALNQQVEMVERELARDPQRAMIRLHDLRPLVTAAIDDLRRQIYALRPLYLDDLGFVPALEMLAHQVCQHHKIGCEFTITGELNSELTQPIQISLYRIAQEALQNVVKHAQATQVHMALHFDATYLTLSIADNGVGFTVPDRSYRLAQEGHFELLGMKERVQLHGGTLRIESQHGSGTTLFIHLPLNAPSTMPSLLVSGPKTRTES
jgi:signal transduction histidine kinase